MSHDHIHQAPPAPVVAALVRAGISLETALAMERWKAQEVLDLLRASAVPEHPRMPRMRPGRATI